MADRAAANNQITNTFFIGTVVGNGLPIAEKTFHAHYCREDGFATARL
jgi:hypothetical protein